MQEKIEISFSTHPTLPGWVIAEITTKAGIVLRQSGVDKYAALGGLIALYHEKFNVTLVNFDKCR